MADPTSAASPIQASKPQLIRATLIAAIGAGVLLVTTVLPAEYGIDPTGMGEALGLTALNEGSATQEQLRPEGVPPKVADAVIASESPYRTEEMSLTLQPGEGTEIKARMQAGESFVFAWSTNGDGLNFDMHGEPLNAGTESSSYWLDRNQSQANGSFIAPFDGTHGWYWANKGSAPVTVTVKVSGFFEKLYRPG
jgi:hypothetical protein